MEKSLTLHDDSRTPTLTFLKKNENFSMTFPPQHFYENTAEY